MYPEEFSEIEQMLEGVDGELMLMILGVLGVFLLVVGLFVLVGYVFQSVGLYTLAKRRGIQNPWLAWLPVGNYWIAGSIADQYRFVTEGSVKNRRKILLVLSLAGILLSSLISTVVTGNLMLTTEAVSAEQLTELGILGTVLDLISSALELATFVFWQIALYDLYTSCNPKNNVLFLVLGILFGFLVPFFIFACRNKEEGMPARREEPRYDGQPNPEYRDYREPWDNP